MKIIAYHISRELGIFNSLGEKSSGSQDILAFLLQDYGESIKVFDQLDYCIACLCHLLALTFQECFALSTYKQVKLKGSIEIHYLPGKFASVQKGNVKAQFSDVAQYDSLYDNPLETELDSICFGQVKNAGDLAQDVYNACVSLGFKPQNLISPSNVFVSQKIKKELWDYKRQRFNLPTIADVPVEVLQYADESLRGNWTQANFRGSYK
jgi:hypothetical protein